MAAGKGTVSESSQGKSVKLVFKPSGAGQRREYTLHAGSGGIDQAYQQAEAALGLKQSGRPKSGRHTFDQRMRKNGGPK